MPSGTPALLTSTSTGASRDAIDATPAFTASGEVTSNGAATARPPPVSISLATCSARSAWRSLIATAAPRAASARAIPAPTFCPAPVTRATFPERSNITSSPAEGHFDSLAQRVRGIERMPAHRDGEFEILGALGPRQLLQQHQPARALVDQLAGRREYRDVQRRRGELAVYTEPVDPDLAL